VLGTHRLIRHGLAPAPLLNGGRTHAVALGQGPSPLFTSLDCATHCLSRSGAAMENLAPESEFTLVQAYASGDMVVLVAIE
jgi:hypothetical protein